MGALFFFGIATFGQTEIPSTQGTADTLPYSGQSTENIPDENDSIPLKVYTLHHTKVAVFASMILPGLGQAYNRKYWKIPLFYGGGTVLYYLFEKNNYQFKRFKEVYNSPTEITDPELVGMEPSDIRLNLDNFERKRTLCIIGMGLLYTANIVDAMVDSYMTEYDISKDLSMKVSPTVLQPSPVMYTALPGLKMSFRF